MAERENYREQLERFFQNAADAATESDEAADGVLRDAGVDPDELVSRGLVMIRRAQAKAKLEQEKAMRRSISDLVEEQLTQLISTSGSAIGALKRRMAGGTQLVLQARKLEGLDEDEAKRILREELTLCLSSESEEANDDNHE